MFDRDPEAHRAAKVLHVRARLQFDTFLWPAERALEKESDG
jgi:hypothetical protein